MSSRPFIPGRELSRAFYADVVAPMLADTPHGAGLLGPGSDVLGFDTPQSTDHGWGPRVQVWVADGDVAAARDRLDAVVPAEFRGWPTANDHFPAVEVDGLGPWLRRTIGFDATGAIEVTDWAATPSQLLLSVTAGVVHHDGTGELARVRDALAWYPHDLWVWQMAVQWRRISQEEHLLGRAAQVGDDLGARVLAARLVRDAMRLAFLHERAYAPYAKWLGTAFSRLSAAPELGPPLAAALASSTAAERHAALMGALGTLVDAQNGLGIGEPSPTNAAPFFERPFTVIWAEAVADRLAAAVPDATVRALGWFGAIDQWADSTDVLSNPAALTITRRVYG